MGSCKVSFWSITNNTGNPVDQSKLIANTRCKARESVITGFEFAPDCMTKWSDFFKPVAYRSDAKAQQL